MPLDVTTKTALGIATGVIVTCLSASWFYYDYHRRPKPPKPVDIETSLLKLKRRAIARYQNGNVTSTTKNIIKLPDFESPEDVQRYFLQQVTLGEDNINKGEFKEAAENFANAVIVCLEEKELMLILAKTLHPEVFALLQKKIDMSELSKVDLDDEH